MGDGERFGVEPRAKRERRAETEHCKLLRRDVAHRRPQPTGVLETNIGEHRHGRLHHRGRVVAATEAGLHHRDLDLALGQRPEGGGGEQLELGDVVVLGERAVDALRRPRRARDGSREGGTGDVALGHLHPFGVGDQVRGEVGTGAQPVALEDRRDHARG